MSESHSAMSQLFATPRTIQSMEFSRPDYWSGYTVVPFSRASSHVSHIVGEFFTELSGNPKNTGVGSLSLLQWIFLTQESNQGLLHCRWILYQLSYQGSPLLSVVGLSKYCLQCGNVIFEDQFNICFEIHNSLSI